jgi:hypothetical protein
MRDEPTGLEASLVYLCQRKVSLQLLFYGSMLGIVLNTASLRVVDIDSGTGVVVVLNYVGLVVLLAFSGGVVWRCSQFDA